MEQRTGTRVRRNERLEAYWKENQRLIYILTAIWFVFGFVHPLFVKQLNNVIDRKYGFEDPEED